NSSVYLHGDVIIGALFPIKYVQTFKKNSESVENYTSELGISFLETFYLAIDKVNEQNLLPGYRLGACILNSFQVNDTGAKNGLLPFLRPLVYESLYNYDNSTLMARTFYLVATEFKPLIEILNELNVKEIQLITRSVQELDAFNLVY
ncbi:hypothetical protein B4U80_14501, partial [Leptotrombidium deliense]